MHCHLINAAKLGQGFNDIVGIKGHGCHSEKIGLDLEIWIASTVLADMLAVLGLIAVLYGIWYMVYGIWYCYTCKD
jgi:hypothetical protein